MNLREQTKGKWPALLPALGVDKAHLTNRHGPCPICGGKDRFRFDDKGGNGTWFCSQCGAGSGVDLVMKLHGWEFKQAAREIEQLAGTARIAPIKTGPDPEVVRQEMNELWRVGRAIDQFEPTDRWWRSRVGKTPVCADLRGVPAMRCPNVGVFSGMVAMIRGADGKPVNLHRTFLTDGGAKADISEPRRVMPMPMPKGCAVRLADQGEVLGIAEGIETAVAASILFSVPVWAAINATNLEGWSPPEGVRHVIVFGDNDASFTGHAASYVLARRMRRDKIEVDVEIPPTAGRDWNDVLNERRAQPQAA